MWNLAKTCAIVTACLAATCVASAVRLPSPVAIKRHRSMPVAYPQAPFVSVTVSGEPLNLGSVPGPGMHQARSQMTAHVVANCPYHIEASFTGLRHGGKVIAPQHLSVAVNGKEMPIGSGRVTIAQSGVPTPPGGQDVPVDLQVGFMGAPIYPAGRYLGTLVLTIMVGP
jgi:hypothetical protein